jgi:hypothetical protein
VLPGHNYVFADTTGLKLLCLQAPGNKSEIQSRLAAVRATFNEMSEKYKGQAQCYAKLDRATIEQDEELFFDCRSADIRPMQIAAPNFCGPTPG